MQVLQSRMSTVRVQALFKGSTKGTKKAVARPTAGRTDGGTWLPNADRPGEQRALERGLRPAELVPRPTAPDRHSREQQQHGHTARRLPAERAGQRGCPAAAGSR